MLNRYWACRSSEIGIRTGLFLSQKSYINKVLARFNMYKAKTVTTPLGQQFKLAMPQSPETEEERRSI